MQGGKESGEFRKLKWVLRPRQSGYPGKRWGHTAVVHNGRLLVFGGNHSGVVREGVLKIDCENLEGGSVEFASPPETRQSHSCCLIQDNLFVFGGCINQEVHFFDYLPLTNELLQIKVADPHPYWRKIEQKNPIPPRESHVALPLTARHLLIYGGTTPSETMLDDYWLCDLQTATWQQVTDIRGILQPKIGCTMTLIGNEILVFGGQFGQGEDSQLSDEIYRLKFDHQSYSASPPPALNVAKVQTIGAKPSARTGHCCVDFKGKLLLIMGGEGVSAKRAPVLYNDLWSFDLRTLTWSELAVQNRSAFRPRSNFTANLHKNTIFIFGGFINLANFKWTDELVTLTLHQNKHAIQPLTQIDNKPKITHCLTCKFEFLPQARQTLLHRAEQQVPADHGLGSSMSNAILIARMIITPFEALALLLATLGRLPGATRKQVGYNLIQLPIRSLFPDVGEAEGHMIPSDLLKRVYFSVSVANTTLTKGNLEALIYGYRPEESGYDFKNSILRVGGEILVSYMFEDEALHCYLLTGFGISRFALSKHSCLYQLKQRGQNRILAEFLQFHCLDPTQLCEPQLKIIIGQMHKRNGDYEVRWADEGLDLETGIASQDRPRWSRFIKEYFLQDVFVNLTLGGKKISITPYQKCFKAARAIQQPTTPLFKRIRLVLNEEAVDMPGSAFVKLYFQNRRVALFSKYPFIAGFLQLSDAAALNAAHTRCQGLAVREALQRQILVVMAESRKRNSEVGADVLARESEQ